MASIALKTAFRHWPQAVVHPRWCWVWATRGPTGLLREIVHESTTIMQDAPLLRRLDEIPATRPISPIGKMGGTQEYLYHLIRLVQPDIVVETGVFRGISSAFILGALAQNGRGRLYSIDLPQASYEVPGRGKDTSELPSGAQTGFVVPESLRSRWTLVSGNSRSELPPLLARLGVIDVFLHDSEHTYDFMTWEYETAWPLLRSGGVLASDDINWNRAFDDFVNANAPAAAARVNGKLGLAQKG
jgi:predicted O-methyltransferase YrrM